MQKEDLLKRMRLFVTITTVAFVVLVVTLLIQFGFIAFYHTEMKRLHDDNLRMQEEIENLKKDLALYGPGGSGEEDAGIQN